MIEKIYFIQKILLAEL